MQRLSEEKLKSLFGELKLHDKEEITWKHLKAEGKDKEGLEEAKLRNKLKTIMTNYDLLDQIDDINDEKKVYPFKVCCLVNIYFNKNFHIEFFFYIGYE